jgi:hypothetical protein
MIALNGSRERKASFHSVQSIMDSSDTRSFHNFKRPMIVSIRFLCSPRNRFCCLAFLCVLASLLIGAPVAEAQSNAAVVGGTDNTGSSVTVTELSMGFGGLGRVGNWLPVRLSATAPALSELELIVTASDPRGDQCESLVCEGTSDESGRLSLSGVFMAGRLDGTIRVRLQDKEGRTVWQHTVACKEHDTKSAVGEEAVAVKTVSPVISEMSMLRHNSLTLLTMGVPSGLPELADRLAVLNSSQDALTVLSVDALQHIPSTRRGLDSVDVILLVTDYGVSDSQVEAIRDWTTTGGQLIVSCGDNLAQLLSSPVGNWLQPEFGIQSEPIRSQDLTALQNFVSGASQLQTNRQSVPIVRLESEQPRVVVNSINGPLISRVSTGAGVVTFVAVDLNLKPLNRWLSLSQFYEMLLFERLHEASAAQSNRRGRISSSGVTDLATQLVNVADAIPARERWSSWQAMLLMVVYLVIIGPLDYLVVVRLLNRPKLTWITFPVLVAGACGLAFLWSSSDRAVATVREVHLLDISRIGDRQKLHQRSWSSLSTSDTRYGSVTSKNLPVVFSGSTPVALEGDSSLIWNGRAEDVYGGLYRAGGAGLGKQISRRSEIGSHGFTSVPLVVDGSQAFLAESFLDAGEASLFESQLSLPATGLLDGTFVHHLPVPIRDWVIVFGNRVYAPSPKADDKYRQIAPNEPWTRESGGVRVAEIRDFLRGVRVVTRERKKGDTNSSTATQIQSMYNINGTNSLDIMLMVSLYKIVGGEIYVRLQDDYLRRDEVSDSIQLNTAMLIGLVDLPPAQLHLDSQPLSPAESQTVVRFFLPVRRTSGEIPKEATPSDAPQ